MTAIIAILNKNGVSIAADRIGSVIDGEANKKYDSGKLFMLCKTEPVGIATYQNSQFMGVPLEILIKEYRKNNLTVKKDLFLYKDLFIKFLEKFKVDSSSDEINIINNLFKFINKTITDSFDDKILKIEISQEEAKNIASEEIINLLSSYNDMISGKDSIITNDEIDIIINDNSGIINELFEIYFGGIGFNESDIGKIFDILILEFKYGKIFTFSDNYTGIIISGYGTDDIFPKLFEIKLLYRLAGKVFYNEGVKEIISNNNKSIICPFAQEDVVRGIIQGFNPIVEGKIISEIEKYFTNNNIDYNVITEIKNIINKNKDFYSGKMLDSVEHFSLSELGETSETLINLTSFKRKVTKELETVGGETDVAIISKSDGFVWKKRKHYFDKDLNYHYFVNK